MAERIPQLENEYPILATINVNSEASGHEAFGKTLASLADTTEKDFEDVESDQSQSMYINSVANAEQLKTSAQKMMLENPNQALKVAKDSNYTLDSIKQSAYVNAQDRSKLNAYLKGIAGQIDLDATRTEVRQRQSEAAFTHYANWGAQLSAYTSAVISDPKKAESLHDAMIGSLHNLVSIGALTPHEAGASIKSMSDAVGIAQDYHTNVMNDDATARDLHTVNAHPLNDNKNDPNLPINESTAWLIDHHSSDKTFQGVISNVYNRVKPNFEEYYSLKPHERQHVNMAIQGVQVADGMINSGEPFPVIEKTFQNLSQRDRVLNFKEQATRNALGNYIDSLKNGNFLSVMGQTPSGNRIMENFVRRNAAIENTYAYSNEGRQQAFLDNKNKMVNEAVSWGEAHHIPKEYVNPIPQAEVAVVQNAFQKGQDPAIVLNMVGQYSKLNRGYLASSMKTTDQQMVVQAVSLLGNNIKPQDQLDFIAANQTGQSFLNKDIEDTKKDKVLMTRIYTNLGDQMRVISQNYDRESAGNLQQSMLTTTLRYAKYLAQQDQNAEMKEGFFSLSDWEKYVDRASQIYKNAYNTQSGTNWIVNQNQLPHPLSSNELDVLADHITGEGYERLKAARNDWQYEAATGKNPLKMIVSPRTNDLLAVDNNGKVYYSTPFTANVMPYAEESRRRRAEEKKKAALEAYEQNAKATLNIR